MVSLTPATQRQENVSRMRTECSGLHRSERACGVRRARARAGAAGPGRVEPVSTGPDSEENTDPRLSESRSVTRDQRHDSKLNIGEQHE